MVNDYSRRSLFRLLVIFRWVSLIPPVILVATPNELSVVLNPGVLLGVAVIVNLFITINSSWLNEKLRDHPWILGTDILYSILLLYLSGGGEGPYYLHGLSPLLAASFFFQVRGGVVSASVYSALYIGLLLIMDNFGSDFGNVSLGITQIAGAWIIPLVMGELSKISRDLRDANQQTIDAKTELKRQNLELIEAHERLQTIHDLTRLLQAAPDVRTMQEQVLTTLSKSLTYSRALLGLVKPGSTLLYSWRGLRNGVYLAEPGISASSAVSLDNKDYPLVGEVVASGIPSQVLEDDIPKLDPVLQHWGGDDQLMLVPLIFHEQAVGLLVIPEQKEDSFQDTDQYILMRTLANQAATSLGTTMLCVERAQDLAVEQERNRIAREIHDTVSQSLFGMVYSLDACINMLPGEGEAVRQELLELQSLANMTRDQVRHSIFDLWPSSLTLDIFKADLDHYVSHCFRLMPFTINYEVGTGFNELSPAIRRNLYRITQEALTNVLHHAGVDNAKVHMEIHKEHMDLVIHDQGVGFDVESALSREYNREHFGLHGIAERVNAMGGECRITSQPGSGSEVFVSIPLKNRKGGGA